MASPLPLPAGSPSEAGAPDLLEAVVRMAMAVLASRPGSMSAQVAGPSPMLTVNQTAALMGMSRMTVIRKADAGELPCVVVTRGSRRKMRRFPRAAIEELAARGGSSAEVELGEYTAQWLAAAAARSAHARNDDAPGSSGRRSSTSDPPEPVSLSTTPGRPGTFIHSNAVRQATRHH